MSCACENKKLGSELARIRRLAKGYAQMEGSTVAIVKKGDGTYDFCKVTDEIDKPIIEYITPY